MAGRAASPSANGRPHAVDDSFPLVLNSGRIRDQWHTMTRTGKTARLTRHIPEPYVEIHPVDALACGVKTREWAGAGA